MTAAQRERVTETERKYLANLKGPKLQQWRKRRAAYTRKHRSNWTERQRRLARASKLRWKQRNKNYRWPGKKVYDKNYRLRNLPVWRKRARSYTRKRRATDRVFRLVTGIRCRIGLALRTARARKSESTMALLGCTQTELAMWIQNQFKPGMSWSNRSRWHVDHKRPCASFDLTKPEEQRACFRYTNLQPLWAPDNLRKGKRYVASTPIPS